MTSHSPRTRRVTRRVAAAALVVPALVVSACTGSDSKSAPKSSGSTAPAASATSSVDATKATPKPKPKPQAKAVNPFTGIGKVPTTPTIIVKIDDTAPGRPQVGIDKADIVYIEEAEAGLTRLAAVFGTNKPTVGYVRSTRPSDPDLFRQYGKITEAASGGGGDSLYLLRKSGLKGWINDASAPYYFRVSRSQSSYINLELNLAKVAKAVKTPRPQDIFLRWSAKPSEKGTVGTDVRTVVGSTPVEFRYNSKTKRYTRYINGVAQRAADGKLITTPNVIVQVCKIVAHPQDRDVNGNPSQFTYTVGRGKVSIFRDGRRIDGIWSRNKLSAGTRFATADHKVITLAPGGAWFALVRASAKTTGR